MEKFPKIDAAEGPDDENGDRFFTPPTSAEQATALKAEHARLMEEIAEITKRKRELEVARHLIEAHVYILEARIRAGK